MIFVDTSAWFAMFVKSDKNYIAADGWVLENREKLVTSDFVVDETLTLLRVRGHEDKAQAAGHLFFEQPFVEMLRVTEDDLNTSWRTFRDFADKGWSFTDCTSKVLMERFGIRTAFAFDRHFSQFGGIEVVP